jgi:hypothetical protein
LSDREIRSIVDEVPSNLISAPAREFAYQLLLVNKARIAQMAG